MRNRTLHLHMQPGKQLYRKCKAAVVAFAFLCAGQNAFSQNVGVNTNNPDPSASLEVAGTNKGLLIPRISLQSLMDKATIPNPATALLIYNTNAGIGKKGFFYNSGTSGNPIWSSVGGFEFPSYNSPNVNAAAFYLENQSQSANAIGIQATTNYGVGLHGSTVFGEGVVGYAFQNGTGVLAEAQNTLGTALKVKGKINIAGPGQSPGAGKVLTSDADGNATWQNAGGDVAFSATGIKSGGSENLPPDVFVKLAFANQIYDFPSNSNYNDVNQSPHSTFIVPVTGIYHFDLSVTLLGPNGVSFITVASLILTRNNAVSKAALTAAYNKGQGSHLLSIDLPLLQGDLIHAGISSMGSETSESLSIQGAYINGRLVLRQ